MQYTVPFQLAAASLFLFCCSSEQSAPSKDASSSAPGGGATTSAARDGSASSAGATANQSATAGSGAAGGRPNADGGGGVVNGEAEAATGGSGAGVAQAGGSGPDTTPANPPASVTTTRLNTLGVADKSLVFDTEAIGVRTPMKHGYDFNWNDARNLLRGVAFSDNIDVVRVPYFNEEPLENGQYGAGDAESFNRRITSLQTHINQATPPEVMMGGFHHNPGDWYKNSVGGLIAERLIEAAAVGKRLVEEAGYDVTEVTPFVEPDLADDQQPETDFVQGFVDTTRLLDSDPRFDDAIITGGCTLGAHRAFQFYDAAPQYLDGGCVHNLAGNFDDYALFFETVRADGRYASNDEMHNVSEAIIGAAYGLQTGVYWGEGTRTRGDFAKATDGVRLGYAEHRANWTVAAVYRRPDGKTQLFGGASERTAASTDYQVVSLDRDVFFDGYGPQREYVLHVPGGTAYGENQPDAERVLDITWGDDVPQAIAGRYMIVNKNSGLLLEVADGSAVAGANVRQGEYTGASHQQWDVTPLPAQAGRDFSHFRLDPGHGDGTLDVLNFSFADGGNLIQWNRAGNYGSANQHWYFDYVSDGWFYICSGFNAKCLDVQDASTAAGANVRQWTRLGQDNQLWRLLSVDAPIEFEAPRAPAGLHATANAESVILSWTASTSADVASYAVLRAPSASGPYETIARDVTTTAYVDNTVTTGGTFYYVVRAYDRSLNRSVDSNQASASPSGAPGLVIHLAFDENTDDASVNLNHAAAHGQVTYSGGRLGSSIDFSSEDSYVQLPHTATHQQSITVATWVYWNGGAMEQRIFDFGIGEETLMFLSPRSEDDELYFDISGANEGPRQTLVGAALPSGEWSHLAVTLDGTIGRLYVNGILVDEAPLSSTPTAFRYRPVLNYLGRGQRADVAPFDGRIDDFRIYNYVLSAEHVAELAGL